RAFLDRLAPLPLVVVPGNHDIPLYRIFERLSAPYGLYRRYIAPELETVLVHDQATLVALNTTAPLRKITDGRILPRQLDFARQAFAATAAGAARIVVAHHHFAPAPDSQRKWDATIGAREALACFDQLGVDLILGGHLHRSYAASSFDAFPPTLASPTAGDEAPPGSSGAGQAAGGRTGDHASGVLIVECGTTTSARGRGRERGKNSLNVIQIDLHATVVTHWLFSASTGEFMPASRHEFPRRGACLAKSPD
ncbi:MAG TPA: metallophosphoesterase, partial [Pirellulales bacterium]|nr:metallophosphoesterase [Pirellulales bacterium]